MERNKTIISLLILALLSVTMLFIPAQAAENTTIANISQAINQTQTQEQLKMVDKATETVLLMGIILSPISFLLSVVALWVALKNRRKTYDIKEVK